MSHTFSGGTLISTDLSDLVTVYFHCNNDGCFTRLLWRCSFSLATTQRARSSLSPHVLDRLVEADEIITVSRNLVLVHSKRHLLHDKPALHK